MFDFCKNNLPLESGNHEERKESISLRVVKCIEIVLNKTQDRLVLHPATKVLHLQVEYLSATIPGGSSSQTSLSIIVLAWLSSRRC